MKNRITSTLKDWAKRLKKEIYTLYVAVRDPRTPLYAKLFAWFVIAYALSPIDLIPDFIPILGLVDDLILLPVAITLLIKLIPPIVMAASRRQAEALMRTGLPASRTAGMVIVTIWAIVVSVFLWWSVNRMVKPLSINTVEPSTYTQEETRSQPKLSPGKLPKTTPGNRRAQEDDRSRQR